MRPEATDDAIATLGLGGNIGDPVRAMAEALVALDRRDDCVVLAVSRLYRTPPWGKTDQAWFFNACALVRTSLEPEALLDACLGIEREMKRERIERWGPRTIDLDVLTYGDLQLQTERLELPHPRMTGRGFVMMPLGDIAAEMVVAGKPVETWLAQADIAGIEIADDTRDWWKRPA
jgi:2-amino-4-hydroxy-6-hydroxymethyldihydropteridine diphosphokinase